VTNVALRRRLERLEVIARPSVERGDLQAAWLATLTDDELNQYGEVMIGHALSAVVPGASRTQALAMTDAELYGIVARDFKVPLPELVAAQLASWHRRFADWVAASAGKDL
jgi:hypothetical protein